MNYINPPKIIQYRANSNIELHMTSSFDIYYTTDGTIPTELSTKYTTPITVSKNTTFLVIAYNPLSLSYSRIIEYFAEVPKNYRKNLCDTTLYPPKGATQ